jgi:hypothetical protein
VAVAHGKSYANSPAIKTCAAFMIDREREQQCSGLTVRLPVDGACAGLQAVEEDPS